LGFTSVQSKNFRNLNDNLIDLDSREVFLIGNNGQGKTNLLETIYYLCFASSFRTRHNKQICKFGEKHFFLKGKYRDIYDDSNFHNIKIFYENNKKKVLLNDKIINDRKEIVTRIPCISFCHDDFQFVVGAPERKRWFIDQTLSLLNFDYIDDIRNYSKVLKIRNFMLKDRKDYKLLEVYDYSLAEFGLRIFNKRKYIVKELNLVLSDLFQFLTGLDDSLEISYLSSWHGMENIEDICNFLKSKHETDLKMNNTTTGPHRDRFKYMINGKDFSQYGSTGQLRLVSLILRVSQSRFIHSKTMRKPVLLLDDVLLELDSEKKKRFLEIMPEYNQAFFTFLPQENFSSYLNSNSIVYNVENGYFKKI